MIAIVTAPIFLLASPGSGSRWLAKLIEVTNWRLTHNPFDPAVVPDLEWGATAGGEPSLAPMKHLGPLFDYASLVFRGESPVAATVSRRRLPCAPRDLILSTHGHGIYSWLRNRWNFKTLLMTRHPLGAVMAMEGNKNGFIPNPSGLLKFGGFIKTLVTEHEESAIRSLISNKSFAECALAQWFIQQVVYTRQAHNLPCYDSEIGTIQYEELCANPMGTLARAMSSIKSEMTLTPSVMELIDIISDRPSEKKHHSKQSSIGSAYRWTSNPHYSRGSDLYLKCHQLARAFGYEEWLVDLERSKDHPCQLQSQNPTP